MIKTEKKNNENNFRMSESGLGIGEYNECKLKAEEKVRRTIQYPASKEEREKMSQRRELTRFYIYTYVKAGSRSLIWMLTQDQRVSYIKLKLISSEKTQCNLMSKAVTSPSGSVASVPCIASASLGASVLKKRVNMFAKSKGNQTVSKR